MSHLKQMTKYIRSNGGKLINWYPQHMFNGMQAMMGKLNTVDCIIEVHDARLPFIGRNADLRQQLGGIKPRILVLNKSDLADLSNWEVIKRRLKKQGDDHVMLTDLTGSIFSRSNGGFPDLMNYVVKVVNESDRCNRTGTKDFKIMVVGIPNVGKSTLINRVRQYHLGIKGEPAKSGALAGVARHVDQIIKVSSRPLIYLIDTPGVLEPTTTRNIEDSLQLALCSTISDKVLNPDHLARYLLAYLRETENYYFQHIFDLDKSAVSFEDVIKGIVAQGNLKREVRLTKSMPPLTKPDVDEACWKFVRAFRRGLFGRVMFE